MPLSSASKAMRHFPYNAKLCINGNARPGMSYSWVVDGSAMVNHYYHGAPGAHHARLLLDAADVQNPLTSVDLLQILPGDVVVALVLAKAHQIHTLPGGELLDACHEGHGLGCHAPHRGKALTEMAT
jgi:hypothetical protein